MRRHYNYVQQHESISQTWWAKEAWPKQEYVVVSVKSIAAWQTADDCVPQLHSFLSDFIYGCIGLQIWWGWRSKVTSFTHLVGLQFFSTCPRAPPLWHGGLRAAFQEGKSEAARPLKAQPHKLHSVHSPVFYLSKQVKRSVQIQGEGK